MDLRTLSTFLVSMIAIASAQVRVAPGVPPQQYQQQPMHQVPQHMPQQQMQQQVPQMQQVPVQQQQQFQQVPQQQIHQVPQQAPIHHQSPHGQAHAHHGQQQILNAANIAHEKQHIQEHLEVPMDTSKMTEQELQFHYFKMHDADNNNKLDGCELIKSLIHWHVNDPSSPATEPEIHTDEELAEMIDPVLRETDTNFDGYIEYSEFKNINDT